MEEMDNLEDLIYFLKDKRRWNGTIAQDLEGFYEFLENKFLLVKPSSQRYFVWQP